MEPAGAALACGAIVTATARLILPRGILAAVGAPPAVGSGGTAGADGGEAIASHRPVRAAGTELEDLDNNERKYL